MTIREKVFELRQRVAALEGQRAAAEAELKVLMAMPCPNCQGKGQIEQKSGTDNACVIYTTCDVCNGTGRALWVK